MRTDPGTANKNDRVDLAASDPDLRSSPGVTILNSAVPKPAVTEASTVPPKQFSERPADIAFISLYCDKFQCRTEDFEEDLLWRCMQPRYKFVAHLLWFFTRSYFRYEFHLINEIKRSTTVDDVMFEISDVRHQQPVRGFFRTKMRVRISGQKLVDVAHMLFNPEKSNQPRPDRESPTTTSLPPKETSSVAGRTP